MRQRMSEFDSFRACVDAAFKYCPTDIASASGVRRLSLRPKGRLRGKRSHYNRDSVSFERLCLGLTLTPCKCS